MLGRKKIKEAEKGPCVLAVGDSSVHELVADIDAGQVVYCDDVADLASNRPKSRFDSVVVGYETSDTASVEAVRSLTPYFRSFPKFILTLKTEDQEKILKYEHGSSYIPVRDKYEAIEILVAN